MAHPIERSDFRELVRHNGDFRKHYGLIVGACLYALSLRVFVGRAFPWTSILVALVAAGLGFLKRHGG